MGVNISRHRECQEQTQKNPRKLKKELKRAWRLQKCVKGAPPHERAACHAVYKNNRWRINQLLGKTQKKPAPLETEEEQTMRITAIVEIIGHAILRMLHLHAEDAESYIDRADELMQALGYDDSLPPDINEQHWFVFLNTDDTRGFDENDWLIESVLGRLGEIPVRDNSDSAA